jgi:FkbM family methyltransferase
MRDSTLERIAKGALDRLLALRIAREPMLRLGRYVKNRVDGDNDEDMATNGELALVQAVQAIFAGRPVVIFDVGANLGAWTRHLRPGLTSGSTIYAFEAVGRIFTELERNLSALGPGAALFPVHAALSDADGSAEIFVYDELGGTSSLHERDLELLGAAAAKREGVRLLRGDRFCAERGIERIGFLKLDVEGHELAVLRGFERMLGEGRIDAIQFEYGGTWIDARTWLRDAFEWLGKQGYRIGKLRGQGIRWHPRYEHRLETFQFANYVAARPEWQAQLSALA